MKSYLTLLKAQIHDCLFNDFYRALFICVSTQLVSVGVYRGLVKQDGDRRNGV